MYDLSVCVGDSETENTEIFKKAAGGYSTDLTPDTKGLFAITELENYKYIAELAPGEKTNLYLTLALDGEGMDSAKGVDYSNASGVLQIDFGAYYEEDGKKVTVVDTKRPDTVITPVIVKAAENVTQVIETVKTGDAGHYGMAVAILAAGSVLVLIGFKKRKERQK